MRKAIRFGIAAAAIACVSANASADAVTDWNTKANEIIAQAKLGTPPAIRVMAIVKTASFEAANTITRQYPYGRLDTADAELKKRFPPVSLNGSTVCRLARVGDCSRRRAVNQMS